MNNDKYNLENLIDLANVLSQQTSFGEVLRLITQQSSDLLNADISLIMMLNPRTQQTIKTIYKEGLDSKQPVSKSIHNQISGWLMKYRKSLLSTDIKNDSRFKNVAWNSFSINSVVGVPLFSGNIFIGSLILFHKNSDFFDNEDLSFLEKIAIISAPHLRDVQQIQQYFEASLPDTALMDKYQSFGMLGKSKQFIELLHTIEAAARCDVNVLLIGNSGTGKELIARAIHQQSTRCAHSFVAIDCGAIPEHLIESELFGYIKGAFTGATQDRKGLFEEANQGTFFMDEISNLSFEMQAKLLRILQEREIRPLGSNKLRTVDVRFIAASSVSLRKLVDEGKFREDLFYRLFVYPVSVPTLNERRTDIAFLANHFLEKISSQQQKNIQSFQNSITEFMNQRDWRGNIRELENFIERLVTLAPSSTSIIGRDLIPKDLKEEFINFTTKQNSSTLKSLNERLTEQEELIIRQALEENGWNQSQAARSLKTTEQLIRYRMKKLGISRPS